MSDDEKTTASISNKESNYTTLNSLLELLVNHTILGTPSAANAYQIIPDLSQTIGDYNGEDEIEAIAWLSNINATAALHNWPVGLKLQMVRRHLVGVEHDWWLSRVETITEWADFKTAFKKTFIAEASFTQHYAQMQARCQAKDESTTAYFHNKVRLYQAVNLGIPTLKTNC